MTLVLLDAGTVEALHDAVPTPGELAGRARDTSLEGTLARVETRLADGKIGDVFDLAAACAVAIATGHCFNDAKERTAPQAMDTCLDVNGVEVPWNAERIGPLIVTAAQGRVAAEDLASWLREAADDG